MAENNENPASDEYAETLIEEYRDLASDPESRGSMLVGAGPNLETFTTGTTDGKRETYVALCSSLIFQFAKEEDINQKEFIQDVIEHYTAQKNAAMATFPTEE